MKFVYKFVIFYKKMSKNYNYMALDKFIIYFLFFVFDLTKYSSKFAARGQCQFVAKFCNCFIK